MPASEPTESSPLLSGASTAYLEPGDAAQGTSSNNGSVNGSFKDPSPDGDEERQGQDNPRGAQYEGLPEVKKQLKYILPAIAVGIFLSAGDQTIIVSCYGKIGSELHALNNTSWIATAYFLTLTSFQPLYGKLSDIFGRKPALLFGNMNELIAARAFAGIGGGGMTTVVSIMMSDIVPLRERGTWQGIINIIYASGAGIGAPAGGIIADSISWRWAFLGQFPLCVLAFISVFFTLKLPKTESSHWKTKLARIDFPGALVLVSAVFTLLLGLDRGSNVSWSAPISIVPLCLSLPLFILFVFVEHNYAAEPFAPGHIIFERSLFACYLCNFFSFGGWLACLFYIPLYFQTVDNFSATQAGVRLLPGICAGVSGSLFGGLVMQKTGKYFILTVLAYASLTLGVLLVLLFTGVVVNSTWGLSVGLVFAGFGNGIGVTTTLISIIANAPPEDQAVATACSYLFRSLGSVVGLSISATVVQQSLRNQLRDKLNSGRDADEIVRKVRESLDVIKTLEPKIADIVRKCYGTATSHGFMLMTGIVVCALISSGPSPITKTMGHEVNCDLAFIRETKLSR
ncbi:hypothetical protein MMC26_001239 [Xylographa opegraphella]|nr:hypothetical protein [Xylographa opegraphella]